MIQHEHWSEKLKRLGIFCPTPIAWAGTMPDPQTAWAKCDDPSWMLWIAGRLCGKRGSARHRQVVLATCACVRLVLPYVLSGEKRPRRAIELAEAWARHKRRVNLMMVRAAAEAAAAAAYAAYVAAKAAAAKADPSTRMVAYAADAAAEASAHAAYITTCTAYAAYDEAADAAEYAGVNFEEFHESCLQIIRRMLPDVPEWFEEHRKTGAINR